MSDFALTFLPLWNEAVTGVNLPATCLFGAVLLFWALNIVGALGTELLDFLIPMDVGAFDFPLVSGDSLAGIFDFLYWQGAIGDSHQCLWVCALADLHSFKFLSQPGKNLGAWFVDSCAWLCGFPFCDESFNNAIRTILRIHCKTG